MVILGMGYPPKNHLWMAIHARRGWCWSENAYSCPGMRLGPNYTWERVRAEMILLRMNDDRAERPVDADTGLKNKWWMEIVHGCPAVWLGLSCTGAEAAGG